MVAGKMTESNLVGYVAAMPIPEVVRGINAFALGVRSVNPDAVVKVVWTNTWYDPAREKDAAKSLIEAGCDIIAQHQNSPAPQQAAGEAGVYGIGYNTDMRQFAPDAVLTNPVWNWGPFYVECVEAVMNGTWKSPYDYWGGLEDGVVDIGPYGPMVPEDIKELVIKKKAEIAQGEFKVFEGPIKDNQGVLRVQPGQVMTDAELLSFDWFVEGVEGTLN
jgi:basic membrane protein A